MGLSALQSALSVQFNQACGIFLNIANPSREDIHCPVSLYTPQSTGTALPLYKREHSIIDPYDANVVQHIVLLVYASYDLVIQLKGL